MKPTQEHKTCECGNPFMISNYNPKTEEAHESCDVCGYYNMVSISNMPKDGKIPEGWQPKYKTQKGKTGFVIKIFLEDTMQISVSPIEQKDIPSAIKSLTKDSNIFRFAITYKFQNSYITQIYSKARYRVTSLLDIVSNNPDDYTIHYDINAETEIEAIKKIAIRQVKKDATDTINWIKGLSGTLNEIKDQLTGWGLVITEIKRIK